MSRRLTADVIVVGVGTMGSMTLWRLARRGISAIGIEQFKPGHDRGSGHGESRIIRTAYWEGPEYVPLIETSFGLWHELEAEAGAELLTMTGALMIGLPAGELIRGSLRSAREHGLPHEVLDHQTMKRRYPQHLLRADEVALWEEGAGVLRPERSIVAATERAVALGAQIETGARVLSIEQGRADVTVATATATYHAPRVVVTAGPWLGGLMPDLALPLQVERQVMVWFTARQPEQFAPDRFPVFIHERDGVHSYGIPTLDGRTVKTAIHRQGRTNDPERPERDVDEADLQKVASVTSDRLSGLERWPAAAGTCLYTNTPDDHFVVGPEPAMPGVTILGGFCGHGFKFAPAMGEIAADLALHGHTAHPIDGFSPSRFGRSRMVSATRVPSSAQPPSASQDQT
jgi:sarcosine oxidase